MASVFGESKMFAVLVLLALLAVVLVTRGSGAQHNAFFQVTSDQESNGSRFPQCDNGKNFFVTMFVEWAQGAYMRPGQECNLAGVSAETVAKWVEDLLRRQGIDPATATAEEIDAAKIQVLLDWAKGVLRR